MKLSDIKGDRVIDVIADIIDPIANIAADKEAAELFARKKLPEGADARAFAIQRLRKSVPPLLKTHKGDVVAILAAIEGTPVEEYSENLNLFKLMKDATDLLTDEAFIGLFTSAQTGKSSGSVRESIAEGR